MKLYYTLLLALSVFLFSSCNQDEGPGGSSSLRGYVYEVRHQPDNSLFPLDTVPAVDERVSIIYGNNQNAYVGDDVRTNGNGYYCFDYLRKGDYIVYAISTYDDGSKESVFTKVKVNSDINRADTLYIHTGKANGTNMIRGAVTVRYYNKGRLVSVDGETEFPAIGSRVYLKYAGQDVLLDDVRTDNNGVFVFQRLAAGTYEAYTETEKVGDSYKNVLFPSESQFIEIPAGESHSVIDLPTGFTIDINT